MAVGRRARESRLSTIPYIPALVYQHVLAGEHVSFVDMYNIITPNNSLAYIGPDLIHPTQAGYDLMANAWYTSLATGQAFFTGNAGSSWNATSGATTSWAQDYQRDTDSGVVPSSGTDVYFNGIGGATTLGGNLFRTQCEFHLRRQHAGHDRWNQYA